VTNSSTCTNSEDNFTLGKMLEAINNLPKDPLEEFANKHGYSIQAGDKLILPIELKEELSGFGGNGVVFSPYVVEPMFIKNQYVVEMPKMDDIFVPQMIPMPKICGVEMCGA